MNRVFKISDPYILAQTSLIRSKESLPEELRKLLREIGQDIGKKIIEKFYLQEVEIFTPMNYKINSTVPKIPLSVIFTTKDDMENFGKGLSEILKNCVKGYMNFEGRRGLDALNNPIREISFPDLKHERVDALIIGKSVLATGCTAISLTRTALSKFSPDKVIIVSIFYSTRGLEELKKEFPNAYIFVVGEPDNRDEDGLLVPGVGMLDERIKDS